MKEERYFVIKGPIHENDWRVRDGLSLGFDEKFNSFCEAQDLVDKFNLIHDAQEETVDKITMKDRIDP